MSIIYCGKSNRIPFYIKEADIRIYSIQELAYFIYNYAMLISNSFISKNLIIYINKVLELGDLASKLNDMYNKRAELSDMLILILENSNYYNDDEIEIFRKKLFTLISFSEVEYINRAGDKLFNLKKYEKAISQYSKISKTSNSALRKLAYCYAKLQFFEIAANNLGELYNRTKSLEVLEEIYYCLKLNSTVDKIYEYEENIHEERLADWELKFVKIILEVRESKEIKEKEEIFLMGNNYIKQTISNLIKKWKEKYRYIG